MDRNNELGVNKPNSDKLLMSNSLNHRILLIIEPWAEEYWIEPNMKIEVVGEGGTGGGFEIDYLNHTTVVLWSTDQSVVHVFLDGKELSPQN